MDHLLESQQMETRRMLTFLVLALVAVLVVAFFVAI
jgi:hypothetical protein